MQARRNPFKIVQAIRNPLKLVRAKNKCSVLHLKDCSEVTKLHSKVSLLRENFYFLRSGLSSQGLIVVQPRPEAEAGQSDRGWTVQIKENELSLKVKELSLRDSPLQSSTFKQHEFNFYAF